MAGISFNRRNFKELNMLKSLILACVLAITSATDVDASEIIHVTGSRDTTVTFQLVDDVPQIGDHLTWIGPDRQGCVVAIITVEGETYVVLDDYPQPEVH